MADNYDETWDEMLNKIMDECRVVEVAEFYIAFDNNVSVWIKEYGFGSPYNPSMNIFPSKKTKKKLKKLVIEKHLLDLNEKIKAGKLK